MNSNATRFSQILSLDFDQAGQVASASIQVRGHSGYQEIGYLISCLKNQALSYASFFWDSAPVKWALALAGLASPTEPSPFRFLCLLPWVEHGSASSPILPKPWPCAQGLLSGRVHLGRTGSSVE